MQLKDPGWYTIRLHSLYFDAFLVLRDEEGLQKLQANGGSVIQAPAEMLAEIKGFAAQVEADWAKKTAEKDVDGAAALAFMREEIKKLSGN